MELQQLYTSFFDADKAELPYSGSAEHIDELLSFLDLCLSVILSARGLKSEVLLKPYETGTLPDLSVAAQKVDKLLTYGRLSEAALEQIELARRHIQSRVDLGVARDYFTRFEILRMMFYLDDFESFCMLLALSSSYDRKYEGVYAWLHNNEGDFYATKWLAVKLYGFLFGGATSSQTEVLTGRSPLCRFLCSRELDKRSRSENSQRLVLSRRVTAYLFGDNTPDHALDSLCETVSFDAESYIPFREEQTKRLTYFLMRKAFRQQGCFVAELYGPEGVGRTTMACRAASVAGYSVLKIRLDELLTLSREDAVRYLDMIYTETVLLTAMPCFYGKSGFASASEEQETTARDEKTRFIAERIASLFRFVFWLTPEKADIFDGTHAEVFGTEAAMLMANERYLFWQAYLPEQKLDLMSFANRYILTPGTIRRSAALAGALAESENKPLSEEHVTAAVRQHSANPLGSYAAKINAVFTWDDLVVSDEQKRRMKMICDQVKYRSVVNEDWGFRAKSPYGRGLCALFYGSPGTGKTMAVQVMANELGLDLYRIDLSQLTSKYIGETQKNISRLFDKAKNINAMLFFDEADSMFAKRSEVKDSNDRYANADTAFLLQKLEDFEGVAILATNYVNNIDDAFKRRIKFMINFVFPTPEVRLELWRKILPSAARCDEPLDFEFFAERFELSGSNIKEILTNAAYLAASEGSGICNRHIIEAIKLNFSKYGKILTSADFDYLG